MNRIPTPLLLIAGIFFSIQVSLKAFDAIALERTVANNPPQDTFLSEKQLNAILDGADPTEILEPTAAGSSTEAAACRTGKVIGTEETSLFHGSYYVAFKDKASLVIQVSPLFPIFLVQTEFQAVSATEFIPDSDTAETLSNLFAERGSCTQSDLYLSQIRSSTRS